MATDRERHNVMLMATLRADGAEQRVRVTDISKGGVKVKAGVRAAVGSEVAIELPNFGWLPATVAWRSAELCGLTFYADIDPAAARKPVTGSYARPPDPASELPRLVV